MITPHNLSQTVSYQRSGSVPKPSQAKTADRRLIECRECFATVTPEDSVSICQERHIFCFKCRTPDSAGQVYCPECCLCFEYNRNHQWEQFVERLSFPCRYAEHGCDELLIPNEQKRHEAYCCYRPFPCPLSGCHWQGIHPQDHLSLEHSITAVSAPYQSPLDWSITLSENNEISMEGDGDRDLDASDRSYSSESSEEEISQEPGGSGGVGGQHWCILIGCPLADREKHWFLLTAEREEEGNLAVQIRSLNFNGSFIAMLQCNELDGAQYCWPIPSLRAKRQRAILPKTLAFGLTPSSETRSKVVKLTVSITPEILTTPSSSTDHTSLDNTMDNTMEPREAVWREGEDVRDDEGDCMMGGEDKS